MQDSPGNKSRKTRRHLEDLLIPSLKYQEIPYDSNFDEEILSMRGADANAIMPGSPSNLFQSFLHPSPPQTPSKHPSNRTSFSKKTPKIHPLNPKKIPIPKKKSPSPKSDNKMPQKDAQISTTESLPTALNPHSPQPSTLKSLTWEIFSDGAINSISGLAVKLSSFLLIFLSGQLQESAL
jgi:hypothetical protein